MASELNALLDRVRFTESGNRDYYDDGTPVTSSKGAKYAMQVMPATAAKPGFGIAPAAADTPEEYNRVGTSLLAAYISHYDGDVAKGLAAYNYGPGNLDMALTRAARSDGNWIAQLPAETRDYVKKNLDPSTGKISIEQVAREHQATNDFLSLSADDIIYGRSPTEVVHPVLNPGVQSAIQLPEGQPDQGNSAVLANIQAVETSEKKLADEQRATSFADKVGAAWKAGPTFQIMDWLDRTNQERDPNFKVPVDDTFKFAQDNHEVNVLLGAQSQQEYDLAKQQLEKNRALNHVAGLGGGVLSNGTDRFLVQLTAGTLDPASLAVIAATDGLGELALGSREALTVGQSMMRSGALGATGNVVLTGALQATGETTTPADYLSAAAMGGILGSLGGWKGDKAAEAFRGVQAQAKALDADLSARALQAVGPNASPIELATKKAQIAAQDVQANLQQSLSNVQAKMRFGPTSPEEVLTNDAALKGDIILRHQLDARVAEPGLRDAVAETIAHAEQINAEQPINPKGLTKVSGAVPALGMEPTAMTLLKEDNPVAQAVGKTLVENPTGAGGRTQSVALQQRNIERFFHNDVAPVDNLSQEFRKRQGRGLAKEWYDPQAKREFNDRVWYELHNRAEGKVSAERDPTILKAADAYQASFQRMLDAQKTAATLGSDNLPATAAGYVPHRISVEKVVDMRNNRPELYRTVRDVISQQFQDLNSYWQKIAKKDQVEGGPTHAQVKFDKEFSDRLATDYLDRASRKATGAYEMNMHVHDPENGSLLEDIMTKQGMDRNDVRDLLSQYQKGSAGFTKGRLKFDVNQEIPDGIGGTLKLGDIFEHDMNTLHTAYARRASADIALANFGIYGRQGLETIREAARATGISQKGMDALDQVMAELLNESFGNHKQPWLQNLTLAAGAARLGASVFNQFGDFSAGVLALGVSKSVGVIFDMPKMLKDIRDIRINGHSIDPILKDFDTYGHIGMDDYNFQRTLDQKDYNVQLSGRANKGLLLKTLQGANNAQFIMTGHRAIIAAQTRGMSQMIIRKALEYIHLGKEDVALADMGFSPRLMKTIRDNIHDIAEFKNGRLQAVKLEEGKLTLADKMELRQVIDRGASQIIQRTYPGEVGPWVHNDTLKMFYQFRAYSITAMNKQWSRNVMNYGHAKSFGALMGSLSFAIPIQWARLQAKTVGMSPEQREKYLEQNGNPLALAHSAMNYVNGIGLGQDVFDMGTSMYATVGGQAGKDFYASVGMGSSNPKDKDFIGGVVAPPLGYVNDIWAGVHGNTHKLVHAIPGSNMMLVSPMLNALERGDN